MANAQETPHEYLVLKKFRTVNTQPSREALKEDEFAWLENMMPVGDAYMPAVPGPGTAIATIAATINTGHFVNIGTVNYLITFTNAGGCYAVNLASSATVTIAAGGTFGTSVAIDQWKSDRAVIADTQAGYCAWDGTVFMQPGTLATVSVVTGGTGYTSAPTVSFTGGTSGTTAAATVTIAGGAVSSVNLTNPGSGYTGTVTVAFSGGGGSGTTASAIIMPSGQGGTAISVFSGRVWIANGRVITYTAPGSWIDFAANDGAGNTTITEGFLRQSIQGMEALDNYLYVFGDSAIFIIGDLKVTNNVTTFSFTNLSSTIGSTFPFSITAMERAIIFANKYGVYATFGATVKKISQALDGVFPLIDFTKPVSAGLVTIFNIQCYVISFQYKDPAGPRQIQAVFFNGKWFFTSQGNNVSFIIPAEVSGTLNLYSTSGTDLTPMYSNTTAAISTTVTGGLFSIDNPIIDKKVIQAGIEYTAPALSTLTLEIDSENSQQSQNASGSNSILWTNNTGATIVWSNNLSQTIVWLSTGFLLFATYYDIRGKYIGGKVTSTSGGIILNGILIEYVKRPNMKW